MTTRRALLAAVHIAKKDLAICDDAWGDLVARIAENADARSSALLSDDGLVKLRNELARQGAPAAKSGRAPFVVSKKPLSRKIFKLWTELKNGGKLRNPTPAGLRAFCARIAETGAADTHPDFLTTAQANKVIEALKAWLDRGVAPKGEQT